MGFNFQQVDSNLLLSLCDLHVGKGFCFGVFGWEENGGF